MNIKKWILFFCLAVNSVALSNIDPVEDYQNFDIQRQEIFKQFGKKTQADWAKGRVFKAGVFVYPKDKIDALKDTANPERALEALIEIHKYQKDIFGNLEHVFKYLIERCNDSQEK